VGRGEEERERMCGKRVLRWRQAAERVGADLLEYGGGVSIKKKRAHFGKTNMGKNLDGSLKG